MISGHLRKKKGHYYVVLSLKGSDGIRKSKWFSTGLKVAAVGGKKKAEELLLNFRKKYSILEEFKREDVSFIGYMKQWLELQKGEVDSFVLDQYSSCINQKLFPYFSSKDILLKDYKKEHLLEFCRYELNIRVTNSDVVNLYCIYIREALNYAMELELIETNPADFSFKESLDILFTDYLSAWLEMMRETKAISFSTYTSYYKNIHKVIIPYFLEKWPAGLYLRDVRSEHIQNFYQYGYQERKVTSNTILRYHANIRKAFDHAMKRDLLQSNPAVKVDLPKKDASFKGKFYPQQEIYHLFNTVKDQLIEFAVMAAAFYGLRRSEIIGIKWSCFDFINKTFTIDHTVVEVTLNGKLLRVAEDKTKNKSSLRTLPLVPEFEELLLKMKKQQEEYRDICGNSYCTEDSEYVYVDTFGNRVKPGYLTQHFARVLKNNNLRKIRFHDLRHSCASLLLAKGIDMKSIQEWMGHSTYTTTADIYTHLDVQAKLKPAATMRSIFNGGGEQEEKSRRALGNKRQNHLVVVK